MLSLSIPERGTRNAANRRCFLRVGAAGILSWPMLLAAKSGNASPAFAKAKRCLLLFLTGGPPQLDTFDLKPSAPAEIRGELKPIATNVAGMQIGELCPRLARCAHLYRIVRSVSHTDTVHTSAGYTMLTGVPHPKANARTATDIQPTINDHPHLGSLLSLRRPARPGIPTFVSLPEVIKDASVNEFPGQGGGFLGKLHDPLRIEAIAAKQEFSLGDVVMPPGMTGERLGERDLLRHQLDKTLRKEQLADLDVLYQKAYDLIRAPAVRRAVELDREPARLREAYGSHLFGQGCLLGRRLLEAGVPLVTVYWHYEGPDDSPVWDTHWNNYPQLRKRLLPPTDQALAALFEDLSARGLLTDTLVIVMGEFGRSPRINKFGGRDHWPHAQSILIAGAGIAGGSIFGSTDRQAGHPIEGPVMPHDLMATFLHLLGVPAHIDLRDRAGKPVRACEGKPVAGLLG